MPAPPASRQGPRDPEFEGKVRDSFARQGIMAHLGATLETVEPGLVEISLPYRKELSQQHAYFHAGVVATVADSCAGYAAFSLMPPGSSVLSIEFKVNLIAPADGERLLARGKVVRSGRTITVCQMEAEVEKDGQRTVCMVGQATMMCLAGTPDRPSG
jgi:uncharacterized protein (TIGR00369 family)